MAINWGTKIILLYSGFVLLIVTLVWKSMATNIDLVSEDYYEQEVGFQKRLDAQTATLQLTQKPVITFTPESLLLFFPPAFSEKAISADLRLYHPAAASADRAFSGLHAVSGKIEISRKAMPAVPYIAQLSWESGGQKYYQEFPLNLSGR